MSSTSGRISSPAGLRSSVINRREVLRGVAPETTDDELDAANAAAASRHPFVPGLLYPAFVSG